MAKWAFRGNRGHQKTTITSSTNETTIVTAYTDQNDKDIFTDVYGLIIANSSPTATEVVIKDDDTGTTRFIIAVPAGETRGFVLPKESAHQQSLAGQPWTATCADSVASIEITALFVKNS